MNIIERVTVLPRADGSAAVELVLTGKDDVASTLVLVGQVEGRVHLTQDFSQISLAVRPLGDQGLTAQPLPEYAG